MSIGWYEQFTGVDWEHYATKSGALSAASLFGLGILSFFLDHHWTVVLFELMAALFIAVIEVPRLFILVPQKYIVRGAVYVFLSIVCVQTPHEMLAGIVLLVTGVLNIFAHINQSADARDGTVSTAEVSEGHGERQGPTSFGTF